MAIETCAECGGQVSTKADSCPHCGVRRPKSNGCVGGTLAGIGCFGIIVAAWIVFGLLQGVGRHAIVEPAGSGGTRGSATWGASDDPAAFSEGSGFRLGDFWYVVHGSRFSMDLGVAHRSNTVPDGVYLFVDLTIRNDSKESCKIPPFNVVSPNGAESQEAPVRWMRDDAFGNFQSLNPGIEKRGTVVFDVAPDRQYRLRVSGGFFSGKRAFVELLPAEP